MYCGQDTPNRARIRGGSDAGVGLAVGVLLIDTEPTNQETDKVDITTTTAIRMMLDRCATVDEAAGPVPRDSAGFPPM